MSRSYILVRRAQHALLAFCFVCLFLPAFVHAATLRLSPETGVYTVGGVFTAQVIVNTEGQPINAAEGSLSFNTTQLQVVSISRNSSIFNLWAVEPSYSNSAGTITFGGGSPTGYTGSSGSVLTVTFKAVSAGEFRVRFASGSVLAADGRGTNVLTSMTGGTYTIGSAQVTPSPEYIAPANTPAPPVVVSDTHPQDGWSRESTATLSWHVPSDITAMRTLLDSAPGTIPTKLYENPLSEITISDLEEGVSYFHLQFKNSEGWGRVTHYPLRVDSVAPSRIDISLPEDADLSKPEQDIVIIVDDETSPVKRHRIAIDSDPPEEFYDEDGDTIITLPPLSPGNHNLVIESFDAAGNSIVGTFSFTRLSFDRPTFTEYPTQINEGVIPVIKGSTRPNAEVTVIIRAQDGTETSHTVMSDEGGGFIFIPATSFVKGIYTLHAFATDSDGAVSEDSSPIRLVVQPPGYIQIGTLLISALSVFVPLIALLLLFVFLVLYFVRSIQKMKRGVVRETKEALSIVDEEFEELLSVLSDQESELKKSRKGNTLTKSEEHLVQAVRASIDGSKKRIRKEVSDVDDIVE